MSKKFVDYSDEQQNIALRVGPEYVVANGENFDVSVPIIDENKTIDSKTFSMPAGSVQREDATGWYHVDFGTPDTMHGDITAKQIKDGADLFNEFVYNDNTRQRNVPLGNYENREAYIMTSLPKITKDAGKTDCYMTVKDFQVSTPDYSNPGSDVSVYFPIKVDDQIHEGIIRVSQDCIKPSDKPGFSTVDLGYDSTPHDMIFDEDVYNRLSVAQGVSSADIVAMNEAAKEYQKEHEKDARSVDRSSMQIDSLADFEKAIDDGELPF